MPQKCSPFVSQLPEKGKGQLAAAEVPGSVQALIAARLDTLSPDREKFALLVNRP